MANLFGNGWGTSGDNPMPGRSFPQKQRKATAGLQAAPLVNPHGSNPTWSVSHMTRSFARSLCACPNARKLLVLHFFVDSCLTTKQPRPVQNGYNGGKSKGKGKSKAVCWRSQLDVELSCQCHDEMGNPRGLNDFHQSNVHHRFLFIF